MAWSGRRSREVPEVPGMLERGPGGSQSLQSTRRSIFKPQSLSDTLRTFLTL